MGTFLLLIGLLGIFVFIIMAIVSLFRRTGKAKKRLLFALVSLIIMIIGVSLLPEAEKTTNPDSENTGKEKTQDEMSSKPEETAYTAENVYDWLKESGLIKGEAKDKTSEFKNSEGIVKVIGTGEVDIQEFKTEEQAKKYDTGSDLTVSHKNIYILIIQGQSQHDNFKKVLEAGKPLTDLETIYASEQQKQVAELMQNYSDFFPLVEAYYNLPNDQRSQTYDDFIYDEEVTWTGTIADLDAIGDSIVVYGNPQGYNGEDWLTISTAKTDLMPYVFIVELKDKAMKTGLKKGEQVKIKAIIRSRGDKQLQYNWKLYEGEVMK